MRSQVRILPSEGLRIAVRPSLIRLFREGYLIVAILPLAFAIVLTTVGFLDLRSGRGAAGVEGSTRGMSPGSWEALVVSAVMLIAGVIGILSIFATGFWNLFVREHIRIDGDQLIVTHSVFGVIQFQKSIVWNEQSTVTVCEPKSTPQSPIALAFFDLSFSGERVVKVANCSNSLMFGLGLTVAEAELVEKTLQCH